LIQQIQNSYNKIRNREKFIAAFWRALYLICWGCSGFDSPSNPPWKSFENSGPAIASIRLSRPIVWKIEKIDLRKQILQVVWKCKLQTRVLCFGFQDFGKVIFFVIKN